MSKISLRVYVHEIEALIDRGQIEEAVAHCQHILKIYPKHVDTYRMLGKAYLEGRRHPEAMDIFQRVLLAVPDDFVSHLGMGIISDEKRDLDSAIWHMERAYETNPSNTGVASELRRLYGRRDGLEPPKIRLTRGALARMYAKGGQYSQAIAEIRAVLNEDPRRNDLKVLLAWSYFRVGQKPDAGDVCNELLRQYPYVFDANRIMVGILAGRTDEVATFRKRVVGLDPYAAQATSVLDLENVPDNAVTVEKLDWDPSEAPKNWNEPVVPVVSAPTGEPAADGSSDTIPDWMKDQGWGPSTGEFQESHVIYDEPYGDEPVGPVSSELAAAEIPDWLKSMAPGGNAPSSADFGGASEAAASDVDMDFLAGLGAPEAGSAPAAPAGDVPDWLSGGNSDSSAPSASQAGADNLDWLSDAGGNAPVAASDDTPDWLSGMAGAAGAVQAADADMDWLSGLGGSETAASQPADDSAPDWLSGLGAEDASAPAPAPAAAADDAPDWLSGLGGEEPSTPAAASDTTPDWLSGMGGDEPAPAVSGDDSDWLAGLGAPAAAPSESESPMTADDTPDWLSGMDVDEPAPAAPAVSDDSDWLAGLGAPAAETPIGESPIENDMPDWLSGDSVSTVEPTPAAASSESEEMDWLAGLGVPQEQDEPVAQTPPPAAEPPAPTPAPKPRAAAGEDDFVPGELSNLISGPGTGADEQDDAMKWLESLAMKQGAKAEELITDPNERKENAPDWVGKVGAEPDQVMSAAAPAPEPVAQTPPPAPEPPAPTPAPKSRAAVGEDDFVPGELSNLISGPGTGADEQDDAMKWLESLAMKQGAKAEELITDPNERKENAPDWVGKVGAEPDQVMSAAAPAPEPVAQTPLPAPEPPVPTPAPKPRAAAGEDDFVPGELSNLISGPGTGADEQDDAMKWLESLAMKQGAKAEELITDPNERKENAPDWVGKVGAEPDQVMSASAPAPEPVAQTPPPAPEPPAPTAAPKPRAAAGEDDFIPGELSNLISGPGTGADEQDDAMKWLESLAMKQGAKAEELITDPNERKENAPDWVGKVGAEPDQVMSASAPAPEPVAQTPLPAPEPPAPTPAPKPRAAAGEDDFVPGELSNLISGPGTGADEQDDAMKWLESLAMKQGAKAEELITDPNERKENAPDWVGKVGAEPDQVMSVFTPTPEPVTQTPPPAPEPESDDTDDWLQNLAGAAPVEPTPESEPEVPAIEEASEAEGLPDWLTASDALPAAAPWEEPAPVEEAPAIADAAPSMPWEAESETAAPVFEEPEPTPAAASDQQDISSWLEMLDEQDEQPPASVPVEEPVSFSIDAEPVAEEVSAWMSEDAPAAVTTEGDIPAWMSEENGSTQPEPAASTDSMPDWLKDEAADETPPAPQPVSGWVPEETAPAVPAPAPAPKPAPEEEDGPGSLAARFRAAKAAKVREEPEELPPPPPVDKEEARTAEEEARRAAVAARLEARNKTMMTDRDGPALKSASDLLQQGNLSKSMAEYTKLIKRGKLLEEIIFDLEEGTYSHPVDVVVWQTLGDAYMRANRLQDALDAYTKAEGLVR